MHPAGTSGSGLSGRAPPQYKKICGGYECQRTQGVGNEQPAPVGGKGIGKNLGQGGVGSAPEIAGYSGEHGAQQAEASAYRKGDPALRLEIRGRLGGAHYAVEHQEAQHGQGELQYDQGHRDRPELVVKRSQVVEKLREPHQMTSQCKQHGEHGTYGQPPLFLAMVAEQSQNEQEHRDRAHIHRPGGERLGAPVQGKVLAHFPQVGLTRLPEDVVGLRPAGVDGTRRRAAVEIRYHHVGKFLPAVGPCRGVVQFQSLGLLAAVSIGGTASTHGIRRIFEGGQQLDGVRGYSGAAQQEQQSRGREEASQQTPPLPAPQQPHEQHQRIEQYHYGKVVCDLRVVGLDLEAHGKREQRGAETAVRQPFLLVQG